MLADPFNRGWGVRPKTNPFFELAGAVPYEPVTLPHDAMIGRERAADAASGAMNGFFPGGDVEYLKEIEVPDDWSGRRAFLSFEGVYRDARVFVNGALAAHRPSGYSGFVVQLDPYLRYGTRNTVRVECTTQEDTRWYAGLGIYRPVHLYLGGLAHLGAETLRVTTLDIDDDNATVEVSDVVHNESPVSRTVTVVTEVLDDAGQIVMTDSAPVTVFPGTSVAVRRRLVLEQVRRWGPDDPYRYTARVTLGCGGDELDRSETRFGIRRLQLDTKRGLRINGVPVKLRGACVHHDNGPIGVATIGRADERRVELLKAAGFNALRSAHTPMSKAMLEACDRLGVLVMDEAFDVWTRTKARLDYALDFTSWWEADLEAMIRKDYNHPSVIMYSIGNEIPETGNNLDARWGRRLADTVRRLDPHRYTVNCVNGLVSVADQMSALGAAEEGNDVDDGHGVNDMLASMVDFAAAVNASDLVSDRTEEALGQVDIAGYNYGESRYTLDPGRFPHRIVVGSETSRSDIAGNWALVSRLPHVIGDFCWTGWDYLGEAGIGRFNPAEGDATAGVTGSFPSLTAAAGDLDLTGSRMPASYYRETVFGLRGEPFIAVHRPARFEEKAAPSIWGWADVLDSWNWAGDEGKPVRVDVYSDADEVDLLVNGTVVGTAAVGQGQPFVASFDTVYEPGTVTAVARSASAERGRASLTTATGPLRLRVNSDARTLTDDDSALAFVRVTLVDRDGNLDTTQDLQVRVEVTGTGVLQGVASGDPAPDEPLAGNTRSTYQGSLLAVVRPTGRGRITVTASATGCEPGGIEIAVR
ncbi:glycoside hydrolase family 2 TIM barrel-domain containing protein [Streptomyces sp. NPDC048291]|uniref:glycoside hydrolase family 2 TIM barrel-domain containing protein n=1 Tax=Streptomyces sp. NPDC048291 TaxID=3365530 RepID=UPI003719D933